MLLDEGYPASYLLQLDFISGRSETSVRIQDSREAYQSLLTDTLSSRWNIDPFYLDKSRWKLALFYSNNDVQLIHESAGIIAAKAAADLFASNPTVAVTVPEGGFTTFAACFRQARETGQDYFAVTSFEENERELTLYATLYSARTGVEVGKIRVYRTGNDRFASALRRFVSEIGSQFPPRGKILARNNTAVLIDLGKIDGFAEGSTFTIVKSGRVTTADTGFGIKYSDDDTLGVVTITRADEEISEGTISRTGFYDRINVGDELIPIPAQADTAEAGTAAAQPAEPQEQPRGGLFGLFGRRTSEQQQEEREQYLPDGRTALKPPALADIISGIR
jgi:hypothetical protein